MSQDPKMQSEPCSHLELDEFEIKFKEKLLELQSRRDSQNECESTIRSIRLENHNLQRTIEKMKIESKEALVQLEVAINAVRQSEMDKTETRELSARQKIQLQTALADRDCILERNKQLEVENAELKRSLQSTQKKVLNQNILEERCKSKELLFKRTCSLLSGQLNKIEKNHEKLSEMFNSVTLVGEKAQFHLNEQCNVIEQLITDKTSLEAQVFYLGGEIEKMKIENQISSTTNENVSLLQELETVQFDVEGMLKSKDKEIEQLQKSLQVAFDAMKASQSQCKELQQVIERSKSELVPLKSNEDN